MWRFRIFTIYYFQHILMGNVTLSYDSITCKIIKMLIDLLFDNVLT